VSVVRNSALGLGFLVFGWALVTAAEARNASTPQVQVIVREVKVEVEREPWPEPEQPAHMTDAEWADFEAESACLWRLMRDREMEITLETVTAADIWTQANGGACAMIGDEGA